MTWGEREKERKVFHSFLQMPAPWLLLCFLCSECTRGGFCNFMHLKPISRELKYESSPPPLPVCMINFPLLSLPIRRFLYGGRHHRRYGRPDYTPERERRRRSRSRSPPYRRWAPSVLLFLLTLHASWRTTSFFCSLLSHIFLYVLVIFQENVSPCVLLVYFWTWHACMANALFPCHVPFSLSPLARQLSAVNLCTPSFPLLGGGSRVWEVQAWSVVWM